MKFFHAINFWVAWSLAIGLWVADPFLSMRYYEVTQRLLFYPPNADSIGIPILGAFIIAIIGAPFWFLFCRKAFRHLSGPFKLFSREPTKIWPSIGIMLAFGFCIYSNIQSARHYHYLFDVMQKSEFSHLSELANYLVISSCGWAFCWVILGSCFIAGINAGKDAGVHSKPKISPILILGWLAAFVVTFVAGSNVWSKTEVRSNDQLIALSKEGELAGTWQLDLTEFNSKDYRAVSFRDFRITMRPDRSFAAEGVPSGILFNESGADPAFNGTWRLTYYHDDFHLEFSANIRGQGSSIGGPLLLENGRFVFDVSRTNEPFNIVRTKPSP